MCISDPRRGDVWRALPERQTTAVLVRCLDACGCHHGRVGSRPLAQADAEVDAEDAASEEEPGTQSEPSPETSGEAATASTSRWIERGG